MPSFDDPEFQLICPSPACQAKVRSDGVGSPLKGTPTKQSNSDTTIFLTDAHFSCDCYPEFKARTSYISVRWTGSDLSPAFNTWGKISALFQPPSFKFPSSMTERKFKSHVWWSLVRSAEVLVRTPKAASSKTVGKGK